MTVDEIKDKFLSSPGDMGKGAGYLSRKWNCTKEDIKQARVLATAILKGEVASPKKESNQLPTLLQEPVFTGEITTSDLAVKRYDSSFPLSPDQIKDLVKADGISSKISKVVNRLMPNGVWSYAIDVKYTDSSFYSKEELKEKLKEIFPMFMPFSLPVVKRTGEKALFVMISDDHAGALNGESMFGNEWSGSTYAKRLLEISNEIKNLEYIFDEVHVLSLGDQMNGFNSQTTRGGHEVKSLSNKEQFDIYTSARRIFYDDLFSSGVSEKYFVHDIENSNHTGNDFSYMANKLLEIYLEHRYPQVKRKSYFLPINHIEYGIHTIGFGHGKDDKLMFKPMPLKLDAKTDLFLFQYFDNKGTSPANRRITVYKGDLHSYAMDKGKFGRYINVPSLMGSTDYTEINFGNTEAGALLEVFHKNSKMVQHIPLWF